ncbi:MAG TPA: hypothetical protein VGV35_01875 [Bryobacteraceae bacterium]|nr:hypothetical protein [Bryobacteraceae bacterium]
MVEAEDMYILLKPHGAQGRLASAWLTLMLASTGSAFGQAPTVLNLSHDLVANKIASQNMTPDTPQLDSRPLFEAGVNYASRNHIATVIADRGRYYFLTQNGDYHHAVLNGVSNVTVDLQYSDLYFAHGNIIGIHVVNSANIALKNFTVDYLQLPFTQLTVTGVNASTKAVSFKQLGNYPLPSSFNSVNIPSNYINDGFFLFAFRNGQELRTTGRMGVTAPFNDSSIQVTSTDLWSQPANIGSIQPGDTLVLNYRAGEGAIFASNAAGFTVQNVSIYASGFIGILTGFGPAITIDHVQVIPRPGTDRLISTNADGLHLAHAGANNVVSNNTVRRGCDDAIAIDGQWSAIVKAASNGASVQVTRQNDSPLPIGTSFDFINYTNATTAGTASIVAEDPPPSQQTGTPGELVTLTLDHAVSVQANFGVTPSDPALRGGGTVIRGNLVQEEVFARGIYPAGVSNVTVTDNLIEATNQSGILVEQDEALTYNYKTGPSSGLVIQNNIVDHALGYGTPSNGLLTFAGAINLLAYDQKFNWLSTNSLANISITGNFVTNSVGTGIRMENVAGGQVTGNTVLNYALQPNDYLFYLPGCCETLAQVQADFKQPVLVINSTGVTNSNNTTNGPWIANVSDADAAYRMAPESIAVAYGQNLAATTALPTSTTLPTTLGGVTVTVKDSAGVSRPAGLFYVSPTQIDYLIPAGTASGVATVTVGTTPSAALIAPVGPGLFAANGTGKGVAAALAVRASADGTQAPVAVFQCGSAGCVSTPMDLGASTDILVVELYGTGIRGRSALASVVAQIGGVPALVAYAGVQPQFPGLDQVNLYVPRSLAGAGEVPVVLTVDGVTANVVTINIK